MPFKVLPLSLCLLLGTTTWVGCLAQSPAQQGSAKPGLSSDTRGLDMLTGMVKFYAGLSSLSYTVKTSDSIKQSTSEEKHSAKYDISVSKPASLAVDVERGNNEDKTLGRLNENEFVVYMPPKGYVKQKASDIPADVRLTSALTALTSQQEALFGFLGIVPAQDPMQMISLCKKLDKSKIKFIGSENIGGAGTQHLELISDPSAGLQWEIWIADGEKPWLNRTQTLLKKNDGQLVGKVSTEFSNWQENPKFASSAFTFVPPAGARQIKGPGDDGELAAAQLKGKAAPAIKLGTVDGGSFNLADSKGKEVVVLDFWATWCPPCRLALPILAEVTSKYSGKGVRFCAIDLKEDANHIKEFLKTQGLKISVALDTDGAVAQSYGVNGIPQSVIVGRDGKIKVVHIGFSQDLKERLPKELDAVLTGTDVSP